MFTKVKDFFKKRNRLLHCFPAGSCIHVFYSTIRKLLFLY